MTPTDTPYIHAARFTGAWLKVTVRREGFDYPVTAHVQAVLHTGATSDPVDTAIADHVQFDTGEKKQNVRFKISSEPSLSLTPVVPVPETDDSPELDSAAIPETFEIELQTINSRTNQEYDTVRLEISRSDETHTVDSITDT